MIKSKDSKWYTNCEQLDCKHQISNKEHEKIIENLKHSENYSSVPDHVSVPEVLSPDKAALFTDHNVITFEYAAHVKAPSKTLGYIYDYNNGDFNGLRTAIHEKNLSSLVTSDDNDDINTDWQRWSDAFMAAVKDHIPIKRLKGRNPLPWINGTILNLIKKKNSI